MLHFRGVTAGPASDEIGWGYWVMAGVATSAFLFTTSCHCCEFLARTENATNPAFIFLHKTKEIRKGSANQHMLALFKT